MSVDALKYINGAFRGDTINTDHVDYLMLPSRHARQFNLGALEQLELPDDTLLTRQQAGDQAEGKPAAHRTHKVRAGESLWQIAHDYSLDIGQLEKLNHLSDDVIQPGQVLQLDSIN